MLTDMVHVPLVQEIAITPEEDTKENASAEVAELKEKRTELQNSIKNAEQHIERLKSQDTLLTQYSSGLFSAGENATTSDLLDQTTIGEIRFKKYIFTILVVLDRLLVPNLDLSLHKYIKLLLYDYVVL